MRGTMLYGPRDVRFEERPDPEIVEPTDAIIKLSAACVCGSDLWPCRGIDPVQQPLPQLVCQPVRLSAQGERPIAHLFNRPIEANSAVVGD